MPFFFFLQNSSNCNWRICNDWIVMNHLDFMINLLISISTMTHTINLIENPNKSLALVNICQKYWTHQFHLLKYFFHLNPLGIYIRCWIGSVYQCKWFSDTLMNCTCAVKTLTNKCIESHDDDISFCYFLPWNCQRNKKKNHFFVRRQ